MNLADFDYIWSDFLGGNKSHENDPNSYLIDLVTNARFSTTLVGNSPVLSVATILVPNIIEVSCRVTR
jgi:hypothetical protein